MKSLRIESTTDTRWSEPDPLASSDLTADPPFSETPLKKRGRKPKDQAPTLVTEQKGSVVKKLEKKIAKRVKQQAEYQKKADTLLGEIAKLKALLGAAAKDDLTQKIETKQAELRALQAQREET